MGRKGATTPPIENCSSEYIVVVNPWPPSLRDDEKTLSQESVISFVRWISCLMEDKEALLCVYHKPKSKCVLIEIQDTFKHFEKLLGKHYWREEIRRFMPYRSEADENPSSLFFFCTIKSHNELTRKAGWKEQAIDSAWLEGFDLMENNIMRPTWPKPSYCEVSEAQGHSIHWDRAYCKGLPLDMFPERLTEVIQARQAQQEALKAKPRHIPGTSAYNEAKQQGLSIEIPKKPNQKSKPGPKTLNVGAASRKGLPHRGPKKEPPKDANPTQQAYEHVLGPPRLLAKEQSSPETTPNDRAGSVTSGTTGPLDWSDDVEREMMDRAAEEKQALSQVGSWDRKAKPAWDEDDDDEFIDDGLSSRAAMSSARAILISPGNEQRDRGEKTVGNGINWGAGPSWDAEPEPEPAPTSAPPASSTPPANSWTKGKQKQQPNGHGGQSLNKPFVNKPAAPDAKSLVADDNDGWATVSSKKTDAGGQQNNGAHRGGRGRGRVRGGYNTRGGRAAPT